MGNTDCSAHEAHLVNMDDQVVECETEDIGSQAVFVSQLVKAQMRFQTADFYLKYLYSQLCGEHLAHEGALTVLLCEVFQVLGPMITRAAR